MLAVCGWPITRVGMFKGRAMDVAGRVSVRVAH